MRGFVAILVMVLLLPWATVRAQEQACLAPEAVKALLDELGGTTWNFAFIDKDALGTASCVTRDGDRLRYIAGDGQTYQLTWVGAKQHGHWYRILKVAQGSQIYSDRKAAGLPPATVIYAAIYQLSRETLFVVKFTPPMERISVRWTVVYQVTVRASGNSTMPQVWGSTDKGLDYRAIPHRNPDRTIAVQYAYADSQMGPGQALFFHRRYTPAVLDFIEGQFFERFPPAP